jgi:drug/metabolite transporter (DMT)-like permease
MFIDAIPLLLTISLFPISFGYPGIIFAIFSGVCITFSLLFYNISMMKEEASRVVSLIYLYPLFVAILANIFLKEALNNLDYLGIFSLIIGGFLISVKRFTFNRVILTKVITFILASSFIWAISDVLAKVSLNTIDPWSLFFWSLFGSFISGWAMLLSPIIRKDFFMDIKNMKRKTSSLIVITCLIYYFAEICFFLALSEKYVSLISAISSLQPLITFIYILIVSNFVPSILVEKLRKKTILIKLIAISLICVGIYLLSSL